MTIGFIGCGNMATAIIYGIIKSNTVKVSNINVYDINKSSTVSISNELGINICENEIDVVKKSDVVVLAVKPNVLSSVAEKINNITSEKDVLIISIAAGKSIEFIRNSLSHNNRIIRVMPNINAKVGEAICGYTANEDATDDDKNFTEKLFSAVGQVIYLDEKFFALFGVLGGCTPAMAYMFIDELARAGVMNGMPKETALKICAQAVLGSAKMILESNEHPYDLVDKVCSPGGTTIEAVTTLQEAGFEAGIHAAVNNALEKDKRL